MSDAIANLSPASPADDKRAKAALTPVRSYARIVISGALGRWTARLGVAWVGLMLVAAIFSPFIANSHPLLLKRDDAWSSPLLANLTPNDVLLLIAGCWALVLLCFRRVHLPMRVLAWVSVMLLATAAAWMRDMVFPFFRQGSLSWSGDPFGWSAWAVVAPGFLLYAAATVGVVAAMVRHPMGSRWFKTGVLVLAGLLMAWLVVWPIRPPLIQIYDAYRTAEKAGRIQWKLDALLPYSPADRLRDVDNSRLQPPSWQHPMGTTNNGADLASNMIYATRIALSIGFISTGIAVSIGIVIGGLMGYFSGWVDLFGMRLVEIFSAIPTFILLLTFVAAFGANLYIMMVIIGLTSWVGDAIFIRAEFLKLRKQDFVQAAIAAGLPLRSILFRHMLPNGIAPVLVSASFGVAGAILAESTLSFLGIGLKEEASWGRLLFDALGSGGTFYWWLALYPGLAIFLTVFAYNLVGEALRDAIDPHLQKAAQL